MGERSGYTIKLVRENDIEVLTGIFSKTFSEADKEKSWDMEHSKKYLLYWLKKQPDMFFGAFDSDGKPVGAMAVNIKPWRIGTRCTDAVIFVDAEHQGQGIAKLLFKKVIEEAMSEYGATSFEAATFANKEFPLSWYKKIGINPDKNTVLIKGKCSDILNNLSK
jgi:GNAT superfamily N-acetyltransferase